MAQEKSSKPVNFVVGGGCFWCLDAAYRLVRGVSSVVSGYAGGHTVNPSYEQVSTGHTGHAEVVRVTFDPSGVSPEDILRIFWVIHDPTTPDRQGADVGPQYRSIMLYEDDTQKDLFRRSRDEAQDLLVEPIVTDIEPLGTFYPAEDYHQNYFARHPEAGYCTVVINPKLTKLRQTMTALVAD